MPIADTQNLPSCFKSVITLAALACFASGWAGCSDEPQEETGDEAAEESVDAPVALEDIDNSDYFPMEPGMRWVYDLECPTFSRTYQWNLVWPSADGEPKMFLQRHDGTMSGSDSGQLIYEVVESNVPPPALGFSTYEEGVVVQIVTDDLLKYMIFETDASGLPQMIRPSQTFWVKDGTEEPTITEVQLFELPETPAEAVPGTQPRQNVPQLFSTDLAAVEDVASQVMLTLVGIDTNVPGREGEACLHYVRRYGPEVAASYTEDLWYAKDVGLVRLEQKTAGEVMLIQNLSEFTH